jgi:hypothetical protein
MMGCICVLALVVGSLFILLGGWSLVGEWRIGFPSSHLGLRFPDEGLETIFLCIGIGVILLIAAYLGRRRR